MGCKLDKDCEFPRSQANWAVKEVVRVSFWWQRGEKLGWVFLFLFFSPVEELVSDSSWLRGSGQVHSSTLPHSSSFFLRPWRDLVTGTGDTWWPTGLEQR